ncbi:hypothetical protein GGI20_001412 [Coemansia sp. BCRC 34301]|nr:hypothetical protein GGI20_001412 [Coemansia sp. BCRC 34301]
MSGNTNNNSSGFSAQPGSDALSSFTGLGSVSGLDADAMNLFSSFTNDTATGGNSSSSNAGAAAGFGGMAGGPLGGLGMDFVGTFDMTSDSANGGVDLSSMQLINLNDVPLASSSSNNNIMSQQLGGLSTDDSAAQLMARLLGPAVPQGDNQSLPIAADNSLAMLAQRGLGLSTSVTGQPLAAAPLANPQPKPTGARAGSESSDDMGDIPLAQLALGQGGSHQPLSAADAMAMTSIDTRQNVTALLQNQAAMQALANIGGGGGIPGQPQPHGFNMPGGQQAGVGAGGILGMAHLNQSNGGAMLNGALGGGALLAGFMPNRPPMLPQQALPFLAQGGVGMPQPTQIHGLERASGVAQPFMPMLANVLEPACATSAPMGPLAAQSGMTGVHSTILPDTRPHTANEPVNANLELALPRPPVNTDKTPLDELEKIEDQLCTLLETASKAIRMMTGPRHASGSIQDGDDGLDSGSAKIKPTIKEFMHLVAQVQAGMRFQHKQLRDQGISTLAGAGFQSDVAGFERDLVAWSDAARLLASALNSGLELSSASTL